ncbi:MAG: hypothetical protein ACYTET_05705, partial [Planctomycetota bacterium]
MRRGIYFFLFALLFASTGFAADTHTIAGNVLAGSGIPNNGVLISATGGVSPVYTNSSGAYTITVPHGWSGQVTPSKDGYYFESTKDDEPYRDYNNVTDNKTLQNFDMKRNPVIEGNVTFVTGTAQTVEIIASSGGQITETTSTLSDGSYSLLVPNDWSGIITAQLEGYYFTPAQRALNNVTSDKANQNFEARVLPSISGAVTTSGGLGIEDVEITITGMASIYTNSNGAYTFIVPESGWDGTVTPIKAGYVFSPSEKEYVNLTSSRINQNYTGYLPPIIAGTITTTSGLPDGVLITASNGGGSTTTALDGTYEITVPYDWSGTVTPTKDGYYFNPTSNTYVDLRQDRISNYSGGLLPIISGLIRTGAGNAIEGVDVTASEGTGSTTTGSDGFYSISVPQGWSGTITPSKTAWTFDPENREYTNVVSNQTLNITGLFPLTISGNIRTEQSEPIGGVIVLASNGGTVDLTDTNGYYEVLVPSGWSGTISVRRIGYTFDPVERSYTDLQDYLYNEDFQGLLHNMKVYCWGDGVYGQCDGPVDNQFVTAIAAGHSHSLAVKADGSIDAWGE